MREMECHMDVEMSLDGHAGREVGSPHSPIILHEMFQHATEQGQKEAECMLCWGCQHGLPKVEVSTIQLVGPQTSKEEFRALYYEVYKLRRLQGSPWGEPEQIEGTHCRDSVLPRRLPGAEGGWTIMEEPGPTDIWPLRSKIPKRVRRDTSTERGLAKVREAHQKSLATVATLEEEIGWAQSLIWGWSEVHTHSRSWDCCRWKSQGWNTGCSQRRALPLTLNTTLPGGVQHLKKMNRLSWILTWNLCQRLTVSSRGQLIAQGRRIGRGPPQNPLWRI